MTWAATKCTILLTLARTIFTDLYLTIRYAVAAPQQRRTLTRSPPWQTIDHRAQ